MGLWKELSSSAPAPAPVPASGDAPAATPQAKRRRPTDLSSSSDSEIVSVEVSLPRSSDPYPKEALKALASHLSNLLVTAREERFQERLAKLMTVFQPPDRLGDAYLALHEQELRAREQFLATVPVLDAKQVAQLAGHKNSNVSQTAHRWKSGGKIFAVSAGGADRYPAFQFDQDRPRAPIADVLKILGSWRTNWQIAFWWVSANGWLDDATPLECLDGNPEAVIEAAKRELESRED